MLLSGAAGVAGMLPEAIKRAAAIDPQPGSTYLDAEHVVILMQENRSFDHCFGTLRGVRGYNDPRAITLPNGNRAWLQTNDAGDTYVPFRFDIKNTKATWMGSVPHSRESQVDADNLGRYDRWLQAKRVGNKKFAEMPLTLGHYTRDDIPFYYALADAFTVCDHNFCSAMTCTRPNRLFFWTGTIREKQNGQSKAYLRNSDESYGTEHWKTYPERLEDHGVSWKFYQNDIACGGGFPAGSRAWLSNFGCNPLEWFANFNVKFSPRYIQGLQNQVRQLPDEIRQLQEKGKTLQGKALEKVQTAIEKKQAVLASAQKELRQWSAERFAGLSAEERSLYDRAFVTNAADPDYHSLTRLEYEEDGSRRTLDVPKGDILYQFRKDVESGNLPTVSWLAGAQNFSDHPSAPWYGSYYLSEILDILTQNPEVWKKTIFIVTFDENDGYYDHVPPFVSPDPKDPKSGKCSAGIDTTVEYVYREQELAQGVSKHSARTGPIGLGFRVPLIVASPWSRGGQVCSQIFDHTSTLQFLEQFFKHKMGKDIREDHISEWRRTICGDLTTVFKPYTGAAVAPLPFLKKEPFLEQIYNAKFKGVPATFKPLSAAEIATINTDPASSSLLPRQEKGIRPSCALFYELYTDGALDADKRHISLRFTAANTAFGQKALGAPFNVYAPGIPLRPGERGSRTYTVKAGDHLEDSWPLSAFDHNVYQLQVHGPNGFFRSLKGSASDPQLEIACQYEQKKGLQKKLSGNIVLQLTNTDPSKAYTIVIKDHAYKNAPVTKTLDRGPAGTRNVVLDLSKNHGWYDFSVYVNGHTDFERRFSGHVETGQDSFSDPLMGQTI